MSKRPALIAFDLDDTLFKERQYLLSGQRVLAASLSEATGEDSASLLRIINGHHPKGIEAALDYLAGKGIKPPFTVAELVEIYRNHTPTLTLDPETERTLEALKAHGHRLALISDGSTRHQRAKFNALGLDRFIAPEAIFISEETGGDKHTPVPFALAEKLYGAQTGARFYVGDNLSKDFIHPNRRGWTTVMAADTDGTNVFPQNPTAWPAANRPAITITTLPQLLAIL